MRWLAPALAAALSAGAWADGSQASAAAPPLQAGSRPVAPRLRPPAIRRRFFFPPYFRVPRYRYRPPRLLPLPPPGENLAPPPLGPSPLEQGIPGMPPLPQGFVLTVTVGPGATFKVPAMLNRYVDVGQALGACFAPPSGVNWGSITLRVAFKRDGAVFGDPRIPYSDAPTPEQKTELARSLLAALKRCTPLPLSPSLGGAVAGEIFAIRFIHQDKP